MTDRPRPHKFSRADKVLLTVTTMYCLTVGIGLTGAVSSAFERSGLSTVEVFMGVGVFLWFFLLGLLIDRREFGRTMFCVATLAILGTVLGLFSLWYRAMWSI